MGVHVEDGLARVRAGVEHETEVSVGMLCGEGVRQADELGHQLRIAGRELDDVAVVLGLGDHQQVQGRLRGDVADREGVLGLRDDLGRDLSVADAREDRRLEPGP